MFFLNEDVVAQHPRPAGLSHEKTKDHNIFVQEDHSFDPEKSPRGPRPHQDIEPTNDHIHINPIPSLVTSSSRPIIAGATSSSTLPLPPTSTPRPNDLDLSGQNEQHFYRVTDPNIFWLNRRPYVLHNKIGRGGFYAVTK